MVLDFFLYLLAMAAFSTRVYLPVGVSPYAEKVFHYTGLPLNFLQVLLYLEWIVVW